jgi:hypothetical protein
VNTQKAKDLMLHAGTEEKLDNLTVEEPELGGTVVAMLRRALTSLSPHGNSGRATIHEIPEYTVILEKKKKKKRKEVKGKRGV